MAGVSVVVIAHNEGAFLSEAIESVLAQSQPAGEIIVVNDASTDGTQAIIDGFVRSSAGRVKAVALARNVGMSRARNIGAGHARGDLLAFLDGDDIWFPDKLARQQGLLDQFPRADYTYGSAVELRSEGIKALPERLGSPTGFYEAPSLCDGYLRDEYWNFWPSGLLIRLVAFERSGGFVEQLGRYAHWEDYFFACALALDFNAAVLDEPLIYYRIHPASCSAVSRATGKTLVDERVGLEWFIRLLAGRAQMAFHSALVPSIRARLERNERQFWEALQTFTALNDFASFFSSTATAELLTLVDRLSVQHRRGASGT